MSAETGRGIEMYMAKYLLSIEEFMEKEKGEALLDRAFSCVDETRRKKAERLKPGRARAACLGAGLLLQLAVREALTAGERKSADEPAADETGAPAALKRHTASGLLAHVEDVQQFDLTYRYGEKGKPYFQKLPFRFSISHSGDYVLCGLSTEELGADIQKRQGGDVGRLAYRFFVGREAAAVEASAEGAGKEELFYRLWARKEAYGKLTGSGVADVLEVDLLPEREILPQKRSEPRNAEVLPRAPLSDRRVLLSETVLPDGRRLIWEECDAEGYSIALCRYG